MTILRGRRALPRGGCSARRPRRQGVRLRVVARLGGQRPEPPGCSRGHRRDVRANPPFEPDRDGHRPAPVPRRRERLGLTGREEFAVEGLENGEASEVQVTAKPDDGEPVVFTARVRLDTPRGAATCATAGSCSTPCASSRRASPRSPSARSGRRARCRCAGRAGRRAARRSERTTWWTSTAMRRPLRERSVTRVDRLELPLPVRADVRVPEDAPALERVRPVDVRVHEREHGVESRALKAA